MDRRALQQAQQQDEMVPGTLIEERCFVHGRQTVIARPVFGPHIAPSERRQQRYCQTVDQHLASVAEREAVWTAEDAAEAVAEAVAEAAAEAAAEAVAEAAAEARRRAKMAARRRVKLRKGALASTTLYSF